MQVQDASGNPVAGTNLVTATILTGGGTLGGTATVSTGGTAVATFAGLSITGLVGSRTLQFASGALTAATSTAINITAGAPTQMSISTGNAQSATAGTAVAIAPAVLVRDVSNNPVSGVLVTFAAATGGGSALPVAAVATNASGVATATSWTLGTLAGPNTLTATAAPAGITPNPVTFTATGTPGPATGVAITTAPTAGQSGIPFTTQPVLRLVDVNGNTVTDDRHPDHCHAGVRHRDTGWGHGDHRQRSGHLHVAGDHGAGRQLQPGVQRHRRAQARLPG